MDLFSSPRAEVRVQRFPSLLLWFQTLQQPTQWRLLTPNNPECTCLNNSVHAVGAEIHQLTGWTQLVHCAASVDLVISFLFASLPFLISLLSFRYPVHSSTIKQCLDLSRLPFSFTSSYLYSRHTFCIKNTPKAAKVVGCCAGCDDFSFWERLN